MHLSRFFSTPFLSITPLHVTEFRLDAVTNLTLAKVLFVGNTYKFFLLEYLTEKNTLPVENSPVLSAKLTLSAGILLPLPGDVPCGSDSL